MVVNNYLNFVKRNIPVGLCKLWFSPNVGPLVGLRSYSVTLRCNSPVQQNQASFHPRNIYTRCLFTKVQGLPCSIMFCRQMAGHSKWQNIKHIKGLKDAARATLFTRISNMIRVAIREGGSPDPKVNSHLAQVLDFAKQKNMPNSTVDSVISRTQASKENVASVLFEVRAVEGTLLLIDTLTDKSTRTKQLLKGSLKKLGAMLVDSGVRHAFEFKGVIDIDGTACNMNAENAVDIAIEAGAEDVTEAVDDDGKQVLRFLCETKDYNPVKVKLGEMGHLCLPSSGLHYIPKTKVQLSDEALQMVDKIFDALDENPDVVKVYDNIE